jgi:hypothetical protein
MLNCREFVNADEKIVLIGWSDTEERIDPETGSRQKSGLLCYVEE